MCGGKHHMKGTAAALTEYLERFTVSQGPLAGEGLTVLPWQRRFLRGAFASGVASSALSVARGNGKTTLVAGLAAATMDGPLAVPRGETVIVASSFGQARIAFEHVLAFMGEALRDKSRWKVWDNSQHARMEDRKTGARVTCLSMDPRRAHGLAPILVLADEPAQWPPTAGPKMVAALRTSLGKHLESRLIALGTRPDDGQHWFRQMLEGGCDYAQCHAARPGDPPFQKRTWKRANPSLDHLPAIEPAMRNLAKLARRDPGALAEFRSLYLNLGTADTETSGLVDAETWEAVEGEALADGPVVWGVDLGGTAAQSAVAGYWPRTGRLQVMAAFPAIPSLAERGLRDGVGRLYQDCSDRGDLVISPGYAVDVALLFREALARFGKPVAVASDRYRQGELLNALDGASVPMTAVAWRGQGFIDGGEDVRAFRRSIAERKVVPCVSLLLRNAMREARTVKDAAGNWKLAKGKQGQRRAMARDDAAAAAILAVAEGTRLPERAAPTGYRFAIAGQ